MYWVFHVNGTITFIYNKYSILLYELIIIGCSISIAKHQCMCMRWEKSSQNYFPCRSCGPRSTLWNVVLVRRIRPKTLCFNRAFGWRAQNIASTRHTTSGLFLLRRTRLEWVWLLPNADASTLSISTDATDPSVYESACLCLKTRIMSGAEREFQLSAYALFLEGEFQLSTLITSTQKENSHAASARHLFLSSPSSSLLHSTVDTVPRCYNSTDNLTCLPTEVPCCCRGRPGSGLVDLTSQQSESR